MSVRSILKVGKKKLYATRKKNGRFSSMSNIGKSIKRDNAQKSKKIVKPGHGHEGDLKKKVAKKPIKKVVAKKVVKKPTVKKTVKKPAAKRKATKK